MQPGKRLQRYILIGQGGQAILWSVEDEQLKRTVAIKTINLAAALFANAYPGGLVHPDTNAIPHARSKPDTSTATSTQRITQSATGTLPVHIGA